MWAYATLRHYPGQELMNGAARQAALLMQRFKPQEIANTLWSYATLGHDPGNALLDAIAVQMTERIQHFRPQVLPGTCTVMNCKLSHGCIQIQTCIPCTQQ